MTLKIQKHEWRSGHQKAVVHILDRLFYRPDIRFSMPRDLLFTPRFWSSFFFRRPPFSHPTFPSRLFGWPARSLCRLPVGLRFLPPRGFYRPAVFTAPRFLPLRGFYRSAVFTAPRFLPLRDFFRSAFAGSLGVLLFLSALQSSPSSGRILCYRLLRRVSGGTPFLIFFLDHLLNRSRSVTRSPHRFPFLYLSYTLGDHRSSRLLTDGTRAPRVLPPPSWDLSAIGN